MMNPRLSEASSSTLFESVLETLRAAVLAGEFQAAERLHEVKLTMRFGASRTPVRAALQKLASEGLLDYTPNRGYTVREFSIGEMISAYEVRAVLEGLAARLSAERGLNISEIAILQQALREGDDLLRNGQITDDHRSQYGRINACFHETVHRSAGSRLLSETVYLCLRVPVSSPRYIVAFEERDVRRRHDDHHRIFEAIIGREPWRAEMLMRDHVASVKSSLVRSLLSSAAIEEELHSNKAATD
jgi:GntR family transcriptional regulator, vanillate catabolism transcriptional regulator